MAAGINLVKDINPGLTGSTPLEVSGNKIEFINPIGEKVLYAANDGVSGAEWWISDGTELGTYLVKDLNPGEAWSVVRTRFQVEFNGAFYFLGNDNRFGIEIFKTDGTDAGTLFFKDINPGNKSSDILRLFKPHNQLTFVANDGNGFDLWTSDGTYGGTQIVKEIGGPYSYNITRIFEFESRFIFAIQSNSGFELWISDGTSVGTNQVIDLNPGTGNGVNAVSIGINNQVLVFEGTGANGLGGELWRSDGTEAGTTFVKDIYPGAASSKPRNFILINGTLYFFALDANGMGIWTTDGTEMGTQKVKVLGKGTFIFGGQTKSYTYFGLIQNDSFDLWKSDGSSGGTQLVKNLQGNSVPFNFAAVGEKLVFSYDDGIFGGELWISDGTTAGTKILKDINPGQFSSIFQNNTAQAVGDKVYFAANNGVDGNELWETNGTELGTKLLFDLQPGGLSSNPHNLRADGKNLFLSAIHDGVDKMWHWNTSVGTPTLIGGSNPSNYTLIDNTVFFLADDGLSGRELWKYEFTKGELSNESDKVTGIEEDSQKNLSVYPNPTNGFLNVLNARTTKAIQVIDIMGRKVNFEMLESTGSIRIDLTTAQPGIYFLEVLSDNGVKGRVKVLKR
jgi:ELWxxDGT repeat protein